MGRGRIWATMHMAKMELKACYYMCYTLYLHDGVKNAQTDDFIYIHIDGEPRCISYSAPKSRQVVSC